MAVNRISWFLITLVTAAVCVFAGNIAAAALLASLVCMPLMMTVGNLAVRNKLSVGVSCQVNIAKGEQAEIVVKTANSGALPVFMAVFYVTAENMLTGERETVKRRVSVMPGKNRDVKIKLSSRYCGRIGIAVEKVRIYDCFALIGVKCRCSAKCAATVMPNTFYQHVTVDTRTDCRDDSEVYSQDKTGYDLTETFRIRDYVPGDGMRQIHWKLTGKLDRLIVKDPSLPVTNSVLIFWERRTERTTPEKQDVQGEVLVSLCRALLDSSTQFCLAWNDSGTGTVSLREVHDMDDLVGAVPALMTAAASDTGETGAEMLCRLYGDMAFSHIVYITDNLTTAAGELEHMGRVLVLYCGKYEQTGNEAGVLAFDTEQYAEQLAEIEI